MPKPTGYVLYEDARIVVIATIKSANDKTANMVQIWILSRATNPVEAVRNGSDADNCLDCKWRGTSLSDRPCYVQVGQAPWSIWAKYARGGYPYLDVADYPAVFGGRDTRFGAYGEPVLIPLPLVRAIVAASAGYTGYTHQWANPAYSEYRAYFMASTDTPNERFLARLAGWRTFRPRTAEGVILQNEIICPASKEAGFKSSCDRCQLCNGSYHGDPRKDIVIILHGANAVKAQRFVQIGQ